MQAWHHRFFGMHAHQGAGFCDAGTTAVLCAPEMKYRASAVVLAALLVALPLSHLEIESADDSWLLRVDGRPVDIAGYVSERYTQLTRDCSRVHALLPSDPLSAQALSAIEQYSPPDSLLARMVHAIRKDDWLLAQVKFRNLQDAVVLLIATKEGLEIAKGGVWSGSTHPHRPEPLIRRYLQGRVPAAPADLTECFAYQL